MSMQTDTLEARDLNEIMAELERLNLEAQRKNIWIRTKWNLANQKPWHLGESGAPRQGAHNLPLEHVAPIPHLWRWDDIQNYLMTLTELCPLELTERQSVLLTNPAYGLLGVKICNTMRIAVSIYKQGDVAQSHVHTPNASRTIISENGGYTVVEGEVMPCRRGDVVLTPNGTWHGHGNQDADPVIWADTLDWPLMDYLGLTAVTHDLALAPDHGNPPPDFSRRAYGRGGLRLRFEAHERGVGQHVSPMFVYEGSNIVAALDDLAGYEGTPYDGVQIELVNPETGGSVFPTLSYRAQRLRNGQATQPYRATASEYFFVLEGSGYSEIDGQRFEWGRNDFFIVPNHSWRSHVANTDTILYSCTDAPVFERLGQFRAQGKLPSGKIVELN